MRETAVSVRYAQAFFDVLQVQGDDELYKASLALTEVNRAMEISKDFSHVSKSPTFYPDEKKKILNIILSQLNVSKTIENFFYLLVDKNRLNLISYISEQFHIRLNKKRNVFHGSITTAIELNDEAKADIMSKLEKQIGCKLALNYKIDTSLLGGMIVQIGDLVFDLSLVTQLNKLNQIIKRGGGE